MKHLARPQSGLALQGDEILADTENNSPDSKLKLRKFIEWLFFSAFRGATLINALALFIIIYFMVVNGFEAINLTFLTEAPRDSMTKGGILPCIVGTVYLAVGAMAFAFPIGIASAIYLNEYAKPGKILRLIRISINNLAGVPSVVFGLFGLAFFVTYFKCGVSILAGALTLGAMSLPVIIGTTEEALKSVPNTYREASLGLGATKFQTIFKVVLPSALPGILTGGILGISRAAGETAPIMFTAAVFFTPSLPTSIFDEIMALPYHIYVLATAGTDIEATRPLQYGTALVLITLVLGLNLIAILYRSRLRKKIEEITLSLEVSNMVNEIKIRSDKLDFFYGPSQALFNISLQFPKNRVTALIGPSGCGKSTYLRCFNRMNDLIPNTRMEGEIQFDGENINQVSVDVVTLRSRIGMVFQKPNPFPKTIFENVAYGLKVNGIKDKAFINSRVEESIKQAALWDEVKDRLHSSALGLSGGQQQRLCIARALAVKPEIMLMDEPASALDPIATQKIEELIHVLKKELTIIIVTHNMQQAARVSDFTAFFYMGRLIEVDETKSIFTKPRLKQTEEYITGRFG